MKKFLLASLAALTIATPAVAQDFTGPRVGAVVGVGDDDFAGNATALVYGVNAGFDFDLGGAVAGVTAEYQMTDEDGVDNDISLTGRIGGKAGDKALIYLLAGYTRINTDDDFGDFNLDGGRVGIGAELALGTNAYANLEYRYSDYELDLKTHTAVLGVGFRF